MNRLEHKVALVTGAARGIGAAIAQAFVAEGAFVIVSDIDEPGGRATADSLGAAWLKLDVREELAWIGAMARALDSHGRLDVLVNNAGICGPTWTASSWAANTRCVPCGAARRRAASSTSRHAAAGSACRPLPPTRPARPRW
jgi:NAD(P)-dependent dehydrogenase (short-subunit alcohol dehydrogenase family)